MAVTEHLNRCVHVTHDLFYTQQIQYTFVCNLKHAAIGA